MSDSAEPAYLSTPPERRGDTPLLTRPQLLPLGSLYPMDFERLCFRLARLGGSVEQCRFYGVPGQKQEGIDLYVRRQDGSYRVIQCKRRSDVITPSEVTGAVDKFLEGDWADGVAVFVLAVTANLDGTQAADRIETERKRLAKRKIALLVWDETELSALLKGSSPIVSTIVMCRVIGDVCVRSS